MPKLLYFFAFDGQRAGPLRQFWRQAAIDLHNAGHGIFIDEDLIHDERAAVATTTEFTTSEPVLTELNNDD